MLGFHCSKFCLNVMNRRTEPFQGALEASNAHCVQLNIVPAERQTVAAHWRTMANFSGYFMQKCYAFDNWIGSTKATEGVGFEPTVGFPTLDFESSALNRTQPPFLEAGRKTPNAQRPTSNAQCKRASELNVERWALDVQRCVQRIAWLAPTGLAERILCLARLKMLQLKACQVSQVYCILYVHTDSHAITCC